MVMCVRGLDDDEDEMHSQIDSFWFAFFSLVKRFKFGKVTSTKVARQAAEPNNKKQSKPSCTQRAPACWTEVIHYDRTPTSWEHTHYTDYDHYYHYWLEVEEKQTKTTKKESKTNIQISQTNRDCVRLGSFFGFNIENWSSWPKIKRDIFIQNNALDADKSMDFLCRIGGAKSALDALGVLDRQTDRSSKKLDIN